MKVSNKFYAGREVRKCKLFCSKFHFYGKKKKYGTNKVCSPCLKNVVAAVKKKKKIIIKRKSIIFSCKTYVYKIVVSETNVEKGYKQGGKDYYNNNIIIISRELGYFNTHLYVYRHIWLQLRFLSLYSDDTWSGK